MCKALGRYCRAVISGSHTFTYIYVLSVWGCFSWFGPGPLAPVKGSLNSTVHSNILDIYFSDVLLVLLLNKRKSLQPSPKIVPLTAVESASQ